MEETKKKFPSLPPNYVSLQQLQEQRLREQQQKQKEKEEEEERKVEEQQRLKEEKKKQRKEDEEEKKRLLVSQKAPRIKSYDQTSSNRNGRNFSQKSWLIKEKNEAVVLNPDQKVEEVEPKRQKKKKNNRYKRNGTSEIQKEEIEINVVVEAEELPDLDQNLKEFETKKKRKKYRGKKLKAEEETLIEDVPPSEKTTAMIPNEKPKVEEETLIGDVPPSEKTTATIPNENDAGVKNTRNRFRRRDKKPPPPPLESNQTMEIVKKIGDLKIRDDDDDDEKKSTVEKKNGDYSGVTRSRKIINRRKPMDGNRMWIRKDEKTDSIPVVSG